MAPSPVTKLYSTDDFKLAKLLTDPPGGSATYDTLIDLPGIRQVTMTPQIESKQLRGDNRELDADSTLVAVELTAEHAKLSYAALEVLLGGTWDNTTFERTGSDSLSYWKAIWRTPKGGSDDVSGDVHFEVLKCKITAYTLGTTFEDYQIMSFTARGVYQAASDKLFRIIPHENATVISA